MIRADYVVVGAGLTGATIARTLADAGREVVVLEKRRGVGGNCADAVDAMTGLRYGLYGPHYFRTNSERIWEWAQRFGRFYPWAAKVMVQVEDKQYRWPLPEPCDPAVRSVAIGDYNRKMWGVAPDEALLRIERRTDNSDDRLKTDKYQGIPADGYTAWIQKMLEGIEVHHGFDYLERRYYVDAGKRLIYTGPIDKLCNNYHGPLKYRCMRRDTYVFAWSGQQPIQQVIQINLPEPMYLQLRTIEWNHLAEHPSWEKGSLITHETPADPVGPDQFEYPYNDNENRARYDAYFAMAQTDPKLKVCGRLGCYKYMDMDQCIAHGVRIASSLIEEVP